jgi:hypothetical protein
MYAVFCTQGHMTRQELKEECSSEKWIPILVMWEIGKNYPVVPLFETATLAGKFVRRNLPKEWLCGVVDIKMRDAEWMDMKGWKATELTFPRKLKDVVRFDIEILEYEPDHNLVINI